MSHDCGVTIFAVVNQAPLPERPGRKRGHHAQQVTGGAQQSLRLDHLGDGCEPLGEDRELFAVTVARVDVTAGLETVVGAAVSAPYRLVGAVSC
ncbi:hypothetical protein [Streptomyces sp. NPDC058145]|uniref:hypothetical protein n=1 Tax=Streptomyces sp. NPDC058145 TaxID=3346356 RepID=UPI0036E0AD8B